MEQAPFFSVILNTHNNQETIVRTFESVLNQTYKSFEIIIVDDCSTDSTINFINKINCREKFIHLIRLNRNMGVSYARNIGIKKAKGKYIAFIDGDDLWKSEKLQKQHDFILRWDAEWVFSNYSVVNNKYQYLGERVRKYGIYTYKEIISMGNPVGMLTVVVKTSILRSNHFRNIKHEDYDLWIRLSKKGIPGFLMLDSLSYYMKHKNSVSANKLQSIKWTFKVFRANHINIIFSVFLTLRYIINYFYRKKEKAL